MPAPVEQIVTISVTGARRVRQALAMAEAVLRQIEFARASRLSGAARAARIEIGTAVCHLDRALPPVSVDIITGVRREGTP